MKSITKQVSFSFIVILAILSFAMAPLGAFAATSLSPFTATEVASWTADRTYPSGGAESLASFAGRTNVLKMSIDKDNRSTQGSFYYTEGLKKDIDLGQELSADMYLDTDWTGKSVRSGLWGVAADGSEGITAYPIIEFSTKRSGDSTGWRYWDNDGWHNIATAYTLGSWASLTIKITDSEMQYFINGVQVASAPLDESTHINAVILNAYNYGSDSADYSTYWHAGISNPTAKTSCMKAGFEAFGFKNQGQCVRFVETGKDSR